MNAASARGLGPVPASLPYGPSEATRMLHEVQRPVLVVCAEKFSDKLWTVSPSRMIFGDGAAAIVVGQAPPVATFSTVPR